MISARSLIVLAASTAWMRWHALGCATVFLSLNPGSCRQGCERVLKAFGIALAREGRMPLAAAGVI
jgi:hypothetical protein